MRLAQPCQVINTQKFPIQILCLKEFFVVKVYRGFVKKRIYIYKPPGARLRGRHVDCV